MDLIALLAALAFFTRSARADVLLTSNDDEAQLTPEDFYNAIALPEEPSSLEDPIASGMFEGDIDLQGRSISEYISGVPPAGAKGNGIRSQYRYWSNGKIPYVISSSFDTYQRSRIAAAVLDFEKNTCIRWVPRSNERNYVYIFIGGGCYSMVGQVGGRQSLSLGSGCTTKGIILHEMMHAAGFFHEQSRNDRDNYVIIRSENMLQGAEDQFTKYSLNKITHLGTNYDYGSIMHYGKYAFSRNRKPTIEAIYPGYEIGQRDGLSPIDVVKLNRMYKCGNGAATKATRVPVSTRRPQVTTQGVFTRRTTTRPVHTSTKATTTTTDTTVPACSDERDDCDLFTRHKEVCHGNPWLKQVCRKSCGECNDGARRTARPPSASCSDSAIFGSYCSLFADQGYCSLSGMKGLMQKQCCGTCGMKK